MKELDYLVHDGDTLLFTLVDIPVKLDNMRGWQFHYKVEVNGQNISCAVATAVNGMLVNPGLFDYRLEAHSVEDESMFTLSDARTITILLTEALGLPAMSVAFEMKEEDEE